MRRNDTGKHVVFKRFLVSYILILIIPITFGSYAYVQAMGVIEKNTISAENFLIKQSGDIVDNYLSSVDLSVYSLSTNTTLQTVLNMNQPVFGSDKVYQLIKVINDMKSNNISGTIDSTTYIFLQKTDVVIDSYYANYGIQRFYENNMKYDGISYQEWYRQVFDVKNNKTIWPAHKITQKRPGLSDITYEAITYIQSIPQGAIVVQIDMKKVRELLHNTVIDHNGYSFIVDDNNAIVSKSTEVDALGDLDPQLFSKAKSPLHMPVNKEDSLVFSLKSGYNNWYYVCVIPTNSLMSEVRNITRTTVLDVIVILVVGCLIAFFFSRKESKPIYEILSSLANALPSQRRDKDEYSLIKDNINSLIDKNKNMNESMSELKNLLLGQLLHGTVSNLQEIKTALANLGTSLEGKRFAVLVATMNQNVEVKTLDVNTILEEKIINRLAESILVRYMNGNGCTCSIDPQNIGAILCFENVDDETCRKELGAYIDTINDELIKTCHIGFGYGVGSIYHSLQDVSFSFSEAKVALQHLNFGVSSEYMIWYSDLPVSRCSYYYPLDVEKMLVNMVKSGNKEELKRTLHHINQKNFIERCLPFSMQSQLFHEMKATLLKICDETNAGESLKELKDLKMWDTSSKDCLSELSKEFFNLGALINSNKRSHNKKMLDEIIDFLRTNFYNPNISLDSVSSGYKISASYLSQFFKEQTGQNFSDYLEELRMKEACVLLTNQSLTVEEIAGRVGYNTPYSFRRAFKRCIGKLPNEYRGNL